MGVVIRNKKIFYNLYNKNLLGNKLKTWYTLRDIKKDNYSGPLMIRQTTGHGGLVKEFKNLDELSDYINSSLVDKEAREHFIYNECAPDDRVVLQGEVKYLDDGRLYLYCARSCRGMRMREALAKHAESFYGMQARAILGQMLNNASYDDLFGLLEEYEGHVVEFSAYSINVGWAKGRNILIWEVRYY